MENIKIIPYSSELGPFFKSINQPWVEELFAIEAFDQAQFDNPEDTIIKPGGAILFAALGEEIVGTVGLHRISDGNYELVKMGVMPTAQGKGVGMLLGEAILEKAREMEGKKVVLYSHSKLISALKIYRKLGFKEAELEEGKYCRCDIKMELQLSNL
ncbi:acetyltransferase (GNAT) family protein [Algoriphagus ratkowskyi]|uniref:Acetyltransferase (GNAT) family protein n=1 Tax=Algoriphagus ratkowskyi TaxID=57028 RepID=A0A2W7SE46_9BACT|nr:GNAT family N-acetyltransferase [Algoriphagus ratkowskyi]PZX61115.1 acetyltransferase (GNAT) family protein [Algoriphagus ratkowskyi]TXD79245.1 GNAT family N-acetyltransferase [Algoriphagus ratkowskyi]